MSDRDEYHLQQSEIMVATDAFRDGAFAFITEGCLALRPLCHEGVDAPIPNGESAVTALVYDAARRKLYGATSGERAHLFWYDPSPAAEHVVDIGVLGERSACRHLFALGDGSLVGIVQPAGRVFRYCPAGEYSVIWTYHANEIGFLPVELGEVRAAAVDRARQFLYVVRAPGGEIVKVDLAGDHDPGEVQTCARVERPDRSNAIGLDAEGGLWGSGANGHFFTCQPDTGEIEVLPEQLPSPKGMEFLNGIDAMMSHPDGFLVGGTVLGTLFKLDPRGRRVQGFGRPLADHRIRCLAVGRDHAVYGSAGSPERMSHLFRFDPASGEVKDLGIPMVHYPSNWICHRIGALAVGANGEVYLGEEDRIGHLFIYYPPVPAR